MLVVAVIVVLLLSFLWAVQTSLIAAFIPAVRAQGYLLNTLLLINHCLLNNCNVYLFSHIVLIFKNIVSLKCCVFKQLQCTTIFVYLTGSISFLAEPSTLTLTNCHSSFYFAICKRGLIDVSKQCLLGYVMQLKKHSREISSPLHSIINEQQNKSDRKCQCNIFPTHHWQCFFLI